MQASTQSLAKNRVRNIDMHVKYNVYNMISCMTNDCVLQTVKMFANPLLYEICTLFEKVLAWHVTTAII